MSFAGTRSYSSYRPQGLKKKGNTGKSSRFTPTRAQIDCAKVRIEGVLNKHRGAFPCLAAADRVHRELVGPVYSRGGQLGNNPDEICETIRVALAELIAEGKVRLEDNSEGQLHLMLKSWHQGKVHKDKYHQNRTSRRGRSQAAA